MVVLAQTEARLLDHNYIGTEHILLGLIQERDGVAAKALDSLGINLNAVRRQVEEVIGRGQATPAGHIPFTPRAKKVLELSLREALQLGHNYIGTEHILLGLIREGDGVAAQVLQTLGADLNRVRQTVIQLLSGYAGAGERSEPGEEIRTTDVGVLSEAPETTADVPETDVPTCPSCFAPLAEHGRVRALLLDAEGEPARVLVVYCGRCGIAIGTA